MSTVDTYLMNELIACRICQMCALMSFYPFLYQISENLLLLGHDRMKTCPKCNETIGLTYNHSDSCLKNCSTNFDPTHPESVQTAVSPELG